MPPLKLASGASVREGRGNCAPVLRRKSWGWRRRDWAGGVCRDRVSVAGRGTSMERDRTRAGKADGLPASGSGRVPGPERGKSSSAIGVSVRGFLGGIDHERTYVVDF